MRRAARGGLLFFAHRRMACAQAREGLGAYPEAVSTAERASAVKRQREARLIVLKQGLQGAQPPWGLRGAKPP